jgi:p-aminobenzoyl-glutamate transporter AbgT
MDTDKKIHLHLGIGDVLAMILSYSVNHSILWCLLHGICGWFYVIYYCFKYLNVG